MLTPVIIVEDSRAFIESKLNMSCPVCKQGELIMHYRVSKIPYFGEIFLMTIRCTNCSLRISDILAVHEKGELPERHEIKISKERLGDLVVLSSGAIVMIPELSIEMTISQETGGEITTVEGVLLESIEYINLMLKEEKNPEKRKILEKLRAILENERKKPSGKLTLVVEDRHQRSAIIPEKLWSEKVEEERIRALGMNKDLQKKALTLGKQMVREKMKELI